MANLGLVQFKNNSQLDAEQAAMTPQTGGSSTFISDLAGHVRRLWDSAYENKRSIEQDMLKALRQRNGEYEADKAQKIAKQGGADVYMLLTEVKCRAAESWLRDIMLGQGELPWDIQHTPVPDIAPEEMQAIMQAIGQQVSQYVQMTGMAPQQQELDDLKELVMRKVKSKRNAEAQEAIEGMKAEMQDQTAEGGLVDAVNRFISDLVTFSAGVIKGPVVSRKPYLSWGRDMQSGKTVPMVADKIMPVFKRVSPFDFYTEAGISSLEDGWVFERHEFTRKLLAQMKGMPGYDDQAISEALRDHDDGLLNNWLSVDYNELTRKRLELRVGLSLIESPNPTFYVLEGWGSVSGQLLLDWGMTPEEVPDPDREYEVNVWQVGRFTIRAVMNYDPLGEKPYGMTSFIKVPGGLWGKGVPDVVRDVQDICNATARAMINNMAIASGPQVEVTVDRLPPGEIIEEMYPWKIWQTTSDPLGSTAPAVRFNNANPMTAQLLQLYEKFARMADEQSGIPAYVYGDTDIQGAGRTASGLSMLMGSAGKGIRQVVTHIDQDIVTRLLRRLYVYNMRFHPDETIKGDAMIVPKGVSSIVKEQLNLRRVEFLQITANPIDAQIVGPKGRAAILREVAKGLEMDVDHIIPSEDELDMQQKMQQRLQEMQMGMPQEQMDIQRDDSGAMTGIAVRRAGNNVASSKSPGAVAFEPQRGNQ